MDDKVKTIIEAISKTKGKNTLIYDFTSITPFVDTAIICSADNMRQVFALATNIKNELREKGYDIRGFEGNQDSRWILIDAQEVIVRVFLDEEREIYHLERLYADLPRVSA